VSRVVPHTELAGNQHSDTLPGPKLALEAVGFGSLAEEIEQASVLFARKAMFTTRCFAPPQCLGASALTHASHPLRDGAGGDTHSASAILLWLQPDWKSSQARSRRPSR